MVWAEIEKGSKFRLLFKKRYIKLSEIRARAHASLRFYSGAGRGRGPVAIGRARFWFGVLAGVLLLSPLCGGAKADIVAAVLPSSRSVEVGNTATAFATIINAGTTAATGCAIALGTDIPATFTYQTTNPATNAATGTANTPVTIAAGAFQTFVFAISPTAAFSSTDVALDFTCTGLDPAPTLSGINTLLLTATASAGPDIVALAATVSGNGTLSLPSTTGAAAFAVATVNVGAVDAITVSADTGGTVTLPVTIAICQTVPATGACMAAPASTVTTTIPANGTPTFGVFVTGTGNVATLPGADRVSVRFTGSSGTVVGSTSVAVQTTGYTPPATAAFSFTATNPSNGTVGQAYGPYCFCSPTPDLPNGLCGSPKQSNPVGGNPPYHFQLDSGVGFPPLGLSLSLNGCLTGSPIAAVTGQNFRVCAIDLNGSQSCGTVAMSVANPAGSESWSGTLTGTLTPGQAGGINGEFSESASVSFVLPSSPGLIAQLFQGADQGNFTGGSFSDTETVTQQTVSPFNYCTLIGGTTGTVALSAGSGPFIGQSFLLESASTMIPDAVNCGGGDDSVPASAVQMNPTSHTATSLSGTWFVVGSGSESGNSASGTFQLTKQ